jgi:hypothetical protein
MSVSATMVTGILELLFVVGDPHLHPGDVEQRLRHGQAFHGRLELVAVPVADEEVAVFVVLVDGFSKVCTWEPPCILTGFVVWNVVGGTRVVRK